MKVLLLEPDRVLAGIYRQALIQAGHTVTMCASAQSAIFAADEIHPDVVILELQLIGHSGIEFLYEFRSYADWCHVPVIINSQVSPSEFKNGWSLLREELGIEAYLYKPQTSLVDLLKSLAALPTSASV